jgi:hypothetical protein
VPFPGINLSTEVSPYLFDLCLLVLLHFSFGFRGFVLFLLVLRQIEILGSFVTMKDKCKTFQKTHVDGKKEET